MTPNDQPAPPSYLDGEIRAITSRLENMKSTLGPDYWGNKEVQVLQQELRRCLGRFGADPGAGAGVHSRARQAAAHESACARLLWPGRGDD